VRGALAARWASLGGRLGVSGPWAEEGERLLDAWSEPHRAYHTLAHLSACLDELDRVRDLAREPGLLELALWFHDARYDPLAHDNEARSAAWASRFADAVGLSRHADRLSALVLATRHDALPTDPDMALLVDVDLSILGQPPAVFDAYEREVRREYAQVPDALFAAGRGRILASLLARPALYQTPAMAERYEAVARANLQRALGALTTA
jgi:predicted metal-dependent HD superfamily phosphohydrolase